MKKKKRVLKNCTNNQNPSNNMTTNMKNILIILTKVTKEGEKKNKMRVEFFFLESEKEN